MGALGLQRVHSTSIAWRWCERDMVRTGLRALLPFGHRGEPMVLVSYD
jgi:hypothetical protein